MQIPIPEPTYPCACGECSEGYSFMAYPAGDLVWVPYLKGWYATPVDCISHELECKEAVELSCSNNTLTNWLSGKVLFTAHMPEVYYLSSYKYEEYVHPGNELFLGYDVTEGLAGCSLGWYTKEDLLDDHGLTHIKPVSFFDMWAPTNGLISLTQYINMNAYGVDLNIVNLNRDPLEQPPRPIAICDDHPALYPGTKNIFKRKMLRRFRRKPIKTLVFTK